LPEYPAGPLQAGPDAVYVFAVLSAYSR